MTADEAHLVSTEFLHRRAIRLEYFTVAWCVAEAIVALVAGKAAGSIALVGFGLDSGIEVVAGLSLLWRFKQRSVEVEEAESRASKIVGATFFGLSAFVGYEAVTDLYFRRAPQPSLAGIILAAASLFTMTALGVSKRSLARRVGSRALLADSVETLVCAYFSATLLLGLALNARFRWWWADPAAALAMVVLLVREGFEAFSGGE